MISASTLLLTTTLCLPNPGFDASSSHATPPITSGDTRAIAAASEAQVQVAGHYLLDNAKLIAFLAHPTLVVDDYDAYVDGDAILLEIRYEPSGILGRRYTTRLRYRLDASGLAGVSLRYDDTVFGAFAGLEMLKSFAADVLRQIREEKEQNNEDVSLAARALESALASNVSGDELHFLLLRLQWAADDDVAGRYHRAG